MPDAVYSDRRIYMSSIDAAGDDIYECYTCGSYVPRGRITQHNNFHKTFTNRGDRNMSNVLWCDGGNHAFKASTPGSAHFTGSQTDEDGRSSDVTQDMCPRHNPYAPANLRDAEERKALTAQVEQELDNTHPYL